MHLLRIAVLTYFFAYCASSNAVVDEFNIADVDEQDGLHYLLDILNATRAELDLGYEVDFAKDRSMAEKKAKKAIDNFLKQLACGYPEKGIPPLAPYTKYELNIEVARGIANGLLQMFYFRFDGLDNMEVKKLKINTVFNKEVQFHFNFKNLRATAKTLNIFANLAGGIFYEDTGSLDFALQNLSIEGKFKYKLPIIFGSIEVYKFSIAVKLGSVSSNIAGINMSRVINKQLEALVPALINDNQAAISQQLESALVPRINQALKGNKIWAVIGKLLTPQRKCKPVPPPW